MKHVLLALLPKPALAYTGESFASCRSMLTGSMQRVHGHSNNLPSNDACCDDINEFSAVELLVNRCLGLQSGFAGCAVALDESVDKHVT